MFESYLKIKHNHLYSLCDFIEHIINKIIRFRQGNFDPNKILKFKLFYDVQFSKQIDS